MRKTSPLQVQLTLTRGAVPLSDQITAQMRNKVLERAIKPGELVPSTRALAASLGVSRMTVDVAYAQLIAEGYLETKPGSGTRVGKQKRGGFADFPSIDREPPARRDLPPRAAALTEVCRGVTVQAAIPLAISAPNEEVSPGKPWTRIAVAHARRPWRGAAYAGPHGLLPLREQIADYVRRMRGITCSAEQVVVTAGTQQGLSLCARVLFAIGERVWLEDPCYIPLRAVIEDAGLGIVPVPVDSDGINVTAGLRLAHDAAGAFVTPSHQYPLGSVLTMERRLALLQWARRRAAWIVEDDYDSELRYDGRPIPALAGLDSAQGSVVYLGTFSKMLFPGLRLGYLIAPDRLVDAFAGARLLADRHAPGTEQAILAEYMAGGHYDAHIRRIRLLFAARRVVLLAECARQLADFGAIVPKDQGMHILFRFDRPMDDVLLTKTLREKGVEVRALSPFYHGTTVPQGLLLGFGSFEDHQITDAVTALRTTFEGLGGD